MGTSRDSDQPAHPQSDQSLPWLHVEFVYLRLFIQVKSRLWSGPSDIWDMPTFRCAGASESWHDTYVRRAIFLCHCPNWICSYKIMDLIRTIVLGGQVWQKKNFDRSKDVSLDPSLAAKLWHHLSVNCSSCTFLTLVWTCFKMLYHLSQLNQDFCINDLPVRHDLIRTVTVTEFLPSWKKISWLIHWQSLSKEICLTLL